MKNMHRKPVILNIRQIGKFFSWKTFFQRLFITIQFYDRNGLANHAAGGSYGFLLSAAPTLLLVSIFLLIAFRSSPHTISNLLQQDIPFLETIFAETWIAENITTITRSGIPGALSVISILWAGRIFALTLQKGLKVIFSGTKKRHPVKEALITLLIQLGVFIFAVGFIISSQTVMFVVDSIKDMPKILAEIFDLIRSHFFPFAALGIVTYGAYRVIPVNPPQRLSALRGALFCVIPYMFTSMALHFIINKTRYNFLYGTLGDLVILLISVYFFFVFFFLGAQFTKVKDSIDVLLFINLVKARKKIAANQKGLWIKIFSATDGPLKKYLRQYKKDTIIIRKGERGDEVFYLLDGKVEVLIPGRTPPVLEPGVFFGEMEHLLSAERTADIKTISDITVLAMPTRLFDEALNSDTSFDRNVIDNLTQRLKEANDHSSVIR